MFKVSTCCLTFSVNLFTFLPLKATFVFTSFIILMLVQSFFCIALSFSIFIDELLVINTGMSAAGGRENDRLWNIFRMVTSVLLSFMQSCLPLLWHPRSLWHAEHTKAYMFPPSKRWETLRLYITQTTHIQDSSLLYQSQWKLCWKTSTKLIQGMWLHKAMFPGGPQTQQNIKSN